jgi:hypothetical protein
MKTAFAVVIFFLNLPAYANRPCSLYQNSVYRSAEGLSGLFHNVVEYYEADTPRIRLDDKAKPYNATGTLICNGGGEGTAQLTVSNNLITTVSHILYHYDQQTDTCTERAQATDCKFQIFSHGTMRSIAVKELVGAGWKCPHQSAPINDWAVLKLAESVNDVDAYKIDYSKITKLKEGDRVMTVAHSIDVFNKAKHFGFCKIGNLHSIGSTPFYMSAPCDCSEGCSGGSLLSDDSDHNLLAIVSGNVESAAELGQAIQAHQAGHPAKLYHYHDQYDYQDRATYYIPLTRDFLKTVEKGSGLDIKNGSLQ